MRLNKKEYVSQRDKTTDPFYLSYKWKKLRLVVLERDNYLCQCDECITNKRYKIANVVDHTRPIKRGGHPTDLSNLKSMHYNCHQKKSAKEKSS